MCVSLGKERTGILLIPLTITMPAGWGDPSPIEQTIERDGARKRITGWKQVRRRLYIYLRCFSSFLRYSPPVSWAKILLAIVCGVDPSFWSWRGREREKSLFNSHSALIVSMFQLVAFSSSYFTLRVHLPWVSIVACSCSSVSVHWPYLMWILLKWNKKRATMMFYRVIRGQIYSVSSRSRSVKW